MIGFLGTVLFAAAAVFILYALLPEWLAVLSLLPLAWLMVEFTT